MKFLIIVFLLFSYSAHAQISNTPDEFSNYRLIGDTAKYYLGIKYQQYTDPITGEQYQKAFEVYQIKEWIRYYGFTQIWWIEPNTHQWISKWMLGQYWKYNLHTLNIETIKLDSTLQPIRIK